jgi:hypothetical protein
LDLEQQKQFIDLYLANNKEFQALDSEQQALFIQKNRAELSSQIETEKTTRENASKTKLALEISTNNTFLENQRKFGTGYAAINKAMHSEVYEGQKKAFGELGALAQSSNAELKAIGKAAAIANITMKTAESAMNIFEGFSTIPFIGYALGIAAAAAAVLYGGEQIASVTAAAQGGLIAGGIPGRDSVPALLMPGELVVPTRNYEEVINAVAAARAGNAEQTQRAQGGPEVTTGYASIELSMKSELIDFVEAKLVERRNLNISIQGRS